MEMVEYKVKDPNGNLMTVKGPADATDAEVQAAAAAQWTGASRARGVADAPAPEERTEPTAAQLLRLAGPPGAMLRGLKNVVDAGADYLSNLGGAEENARIKAMNKQGQDEWKATSPGFAQSVGTTAGEMAALGGPLSTLGKVAQVVKLPRLAEAISSAGVTTGTAAKGALEALRNFGTKMTGGAIAGGTGAALTGADNNAGEGAAFGALVPAVLGTAGVVARPVARAVEPWMQSGMDKIEQRFLVDNMSRKPSRMVLQDAEFAATDPMRVPGSTPMAPAMVNDPKLAQAIRTAQNTNPDFAAKLYNHLAAQNEARWAYLAPSVGSVGDIATMKAARENATAPIRERVLTEAGRVDARPIFDVLNRGIKSDEAGQGAVAKTYKMFGDLISTGVDQTGRIRAERLYASRKDITEAERKGFLANPDGSGSVAMSKQAAKTIKDAIDDAIEAAHNQSKRTSPRLGDDGVTQSSAANWREYLRAYGEMSKPIDQMELMQDVMKRATTARRMSKSASTAVEDMDNLAPSNYIISGPKLENLLKDPSLRKQLSPENLDALRRVAADISAATESLNAGRAVGSNTAQNIGAAAQDQIAATMLREGVIRSTGAPRALVDVVAGWAKNANNKRRQDIAHELLIDPEKFTEALRREVTKPVAIADQPGLTRRGALELAHRSIPLLASDR